MDPLVATLLFLMADKDDVHLSLRQKLIGAADVVGHADVDINVGPLLTKAADDARQPVHSHAGECAHADDLAARGRHLRDRAVKPRVGLQEFADGGRHALAVLRQADAAAPALKQREADLALEGIHHVRQAGLRVAHHLRRLGKAAEVYRHQQRF